MEPLEYRFGAFRLAPAARELWLQGQLVALPPKALDCLIYLVEHRERAVGRDELISAVWGRTTVSDDVLAQTLLRARRAVGDTGNEQRSIRTVPRFGYRWILAIDEPAAPAHAVNAASANGIATSVAVETAPAAAPAMTRPRAWRAAMVLAILAVAGLFGWMFRDRYRVAAVPAGDRTVLVLPVEVAGGDRESTWVRLGAMDYIASGLRERTRFTVLPSEQTILLASGRVDPSDVGTLRRLQLSTGARYVLAPHATRGGGAWSFVIDAYHGDGVMSYEARAQNPLDAANLAASRFAAALGMHVPTATATAAVELAQRMDAATLAGDLVEAHRLVDATPESLKADPVVRIRTAQIAFRAGQLDAARERFQGLALDTSLPAGLRAQVHMGLGAVAVRSGDFDAADHGYSAAIDILDREHDDPNLLGNAHSGRGVAKGARHQTVEALADFDRARAELERAGNRIDTATVDVNLALVLLGAGRHAEAGTAFDRAIETFSRFDVRDDLAAALVGKLNLQRKTVERTAALATARRIVELEPELENPILKQHVFFATVRALLDGGELRAAARRISGFGDGERADPGVQVLRARLALERGDARTADAALVQALEHDFDVPTPLTPSNLVVASAVALRRGGDPAVVEKALEKLASALRQRKDGDAARATELALAQLAVSRGEGDAAAHFRKALAEADRQGAPDAIVEVLVAELAACLETRRLDDARKAASRLADWASRDYDAARVVAAFHRATGDAARARDADADAQRLAGDRDPAAPL